jgi:subtilisin family serine protease
MASPMVAGVVALILEANPYLSTEQVKNILILTAREDNNTGIIPLEGSTKWGWGKINAYLAVKLALNTVGTEELKRDISWSIYPNPVINELHFTLIDELPSRVQIIDVMGKITEKNVQNAKISVSDLKPGNYWIRLEIKGRIEQQAFVK